MITVNRIIASWKLKIKKYFFSYRNGFFELYQVSNSPQILLHNFIHMPFVKYEEKYQTIHTENPFLKVKIFHLEFEEGLLVMLSDAFYKKNVMDCMLYDKEQPCDHFFISLKVSQKQVNSKYPLVNGTSYGHNMWSICKPAGIKNLCHFKDSHEQFYTLFFNHTWLVNYLKQADEKVVRFIKDFLKSDTTYMIWPRYADPGENNYSLFKDTLENTIPLSEINREEFRKLSLGMFEDFISSIVRVDLHANHLKMSNEQRLKIFKAEDYISSFYTQEFPGVEQVAEKVGISPTGLKTGFKHVYGCSIYKYFRSQKMKIAQSILQQNRDIKIKTLASQMGYDNAAKFAAAFKEETGNLPSEMGDSKEVDIM